MRCLLDLEKGGVDVAGGLAGGGDDAVGWYEQGSGAGAQGGADATAKADANTANAQKTAAMPAPNQKGGDE